MKSTKLLVIGAVIVTFIVGLGITSNTDLFKGSLTGLKLNKNTTKAAQEFDYYIIESKGGVDVELAKFNGNKFVEDMNKAVNWFDSTRAAKIGSLPTRDAITAGAAFTRPGITRPGMVTPGMAGVGTGSRDGLINTGISDDRNSVANLGRKTIGISAGGFDDLLPDSNGAMITISASFGIGGRNSVGRIENVNVGFDFINSNPNTGRISTVAGISNQDLTQLSNTFQNMFRDQPGTVGETNIPVDTENKPVVVADNSGNSGSGDSQATTKTEPTAKKEPSSTPPDDGSQPVKKEEDQDKKKPGSSGSDKSENNSPENEKSTENPNSDRGYGNPTGAQLGALSKFNAQAGPSQRTKVDPTIASALRGSANLGAARGNPGEGSSGPQGNAVIDGAFVLNIDCARSGDLCGPSNPDNILIIAIPKKPY